MLRNQLARALLDDLALTQDEGDGTEIPRAEEVRNEVLENRDQLAAHGPVCLQLEQVEEHREDVAPQVLRVLALDLLVEILDLLVIEEIERGVEVVDRYQPFALRRRFFLHLPADRRWIGAAPGFARLAPGPAGERRRLAPLDRHRVLALQLAER